MTTKSTVGALRVVLGLDAAAFEGGLTKAQSHLRRVGRQMQKLGNEIRVVGLAMTAPFIAGATAAGAAVSKLTGQINELAAEARTAGVSFQAFQELKYAADRNQVSLAALTDGLKELQLRADEFVKTGKGSGAEAFAALGYNAATLKAALKDPVALFETIIDRMGRLDKAAQIRVADEIFGGTGGEQFVRFMDQGVAGIRRLREEARKSGALFSDADRQRAEAYRDAILNLRAAVQRMTIQLANSGLVEWMTRVAQKIGEFADRHQAMVPVLIRWAATITGVIAALGALNVAVGTIIVFTARLLPLMTLLGAAMRAAGAVIVATRTAFVAYAAAVALVGPVSATAAVATTALGAALRGLGVAFRFMLGPIGLAITAIGALVAGVGYLIGTTLSAEAATRKAEASNEGYVAALDRLRQYQQRVGAATDQTTKLMDRALGVTAAVASAADTAAAANLRRAASERQLTYDMLRRQATEAKSTGDALRRSARNRRMLTRGLDSAAGAFIPERVREGYEASASQDRQAADSYNRSTVLNRLAADLMRAPLAVADPSAETDTTTTNASSRGGRGPSEADLAYQRESLRLQAQLDAAQARSDIAEARRLERVIDRRGRIKAYEDAGLKGRAAELAADRDLAVIDAARADARRRALEDREADVALAVAQIAGDQKIVDLMERRRERTELIAWYQGQEVDEAEATARANRDLLRIEEARIKAREKLLADARRAHEITTAELSGNERLARQLRALQEMANRAERYHREGGMDPADARRRAGQEVWREESARNYGEAREMFGSAFSDGVRAAMAGDLNGFLSQQFGNFMQRAMQRVGEQLFDRLMGGFDATAEGAAQGAAQGAAMLPAGLRVAEMIAGALTTAGESVARALGSALGSATGSVGSAARAGPSILSGLGRVFAGLPKFSTGAFIPPSGASGLDSQLVAFWKSPRESVSVLNPDQMAGAGGGATYHISGNLLTPEFWNQIQSEVAAGEARAYGRAMQDAPALTMSQTAKRQQTAVGRRRR